MSRVDDDRDDARVAAQLAEARRTAEAQKAKKAQEANSFSKLVGQQKDAKATQQQQSTARSAIAQLLEKAEQQQADTVKAEAGSHDQAQAATRQNEASFKGRLGAKQTEAQSSQASRSETAQGQLSRITDGEAQHALVGHEAEADTAARDSTGRASESRGSANRATARKEDAKDASKTSAAPTGAASGDKGDLKADADQGGGKQGQKDSEQNPGSAAASFRFNPALMAPVAVAKPKEATGSDRLRKVANELAQKIVERVRVGTNALGKVEFQVDLRNDVLAGLSVKVSAHNGKIKAVFSGRDKDVLKMIQEQGEALKNALAVRGLTLEEFKIEARS